MKERSCFLGIDSTFEDADAVVNLAPYDGAVSYNKGAADGPEIIIHASEQVETYDIRLGEPGVKIHTARLDFDTSEQMRTSVFEATKSVLDSGKFPVLLGGDHSVSLGAIKAAVEKYPDLTVVQIDAHADMRDVYDENKFSHACVMRRVHEYGARIVPVGIRSISKEEHDYIKENDIKIFFAPVIVEDVLAECNGNVYVTIDADGFDPSLIPGTGTPVPGGLGWYESLGLFRKLLERVNLVGFDFVELSKGATTRSEDTAALLIYKLICWSQKHV